LFWLIIQYFSLPLGYAVTKHVPRNANAVKRMLYTLKQLLLTQYTCSRFIPVELYQKMTKNSQRKNKTLKMIGKKRNFSFFSPIVKMIILEDSVVPKIIHTSPTERVFT